MQRGLTCRRRLLRLAVSPCRLGRACRARSPATSSIIVFAALSLTLCLSLLALDQSGAGIFTMDAERAGLGGRSFRKLLVQDGSGLSAAAAAARSGISSSSAANASGATQKLPGCIIIGARKSGTRALLDFLNLHPDVMAAPREVHFFSNDSNYARGYAWYRSRMGLARPGQLSVEKTPRYFVSPIAPARVHRMNSSVRLVAILRHPVTRAVSDYTQLRANRLARGEPPPAEFRRLALDSRRSGAVKPRYNPVWVSTYHVHVARWLEVFPREQIHFVDGDRLVWDPLGELRRLESFLGLPHRFTEETFYFNASRGFYCMRLHLEATASEGGNDSSRGYDESAHNDNSSQGYDNISRGYDEGALNDSSSRGSDSAGPERCLGADKGRKHRQIEEWVLKRLHRYFKPHNEMLFKMIGQRFDWK